MNKALLVITPEEKARQKQPCKSCQFFGKKPKGQIDTPNMMINGVMASELVCAKGELVAFPELDKPSGCKHFKQKGE